VGRAVDSPVSRYLGHYAGTPPQQEALRVDDRVRDREPAGMDTALLAYSGISVKMMVDRGLGAELLVCSWSTTSRAAPRRPTIILSRRPTSSSRGSGGAAALGGVIDASRVLSAQASNGETALTFTVLAGIVVGGTSILGGEGAMWRTVVGVLFIALIGNGFDLLGLNPLYEQIALGGILLIAVGADAWSRLRQT
jgi:hypothetical protein